MSVMKVIVFFAFETGIVRIFGEFYTRLLQCNVRFRDIEIDELHHHIMIENFKHCFEGIIFVQMVAI